jgi:hypothetical protein
MKIALCTSSSNENLVLVSYEVSKLTAETGYPHTICEKLTGQVRERCRGERDTAFFSLVGSGYRVQMAEHLVVQLSQENYCECMH